MATPVKPAREGREKQRYGEDGERLTAGCCVLREVLQFQPLSLPLSPAYVACALVLACGSIG
ncbi:MAG: hypothetical protein ACPIOQ_26765 [Promethearchaeia archaeon]|jgi:hypothetical protein